MPRASTLSKDSPKPPRFEVAGSGVRVNAVAPGPIETALLNRVVPSPDTKAALVSTVPLGRVGTSEEIAEAIVFIASDKAAFITGATLAADGGSTA